VLRFTHIMLVLALLVAVSSTLKAQQNFNTISVTGDAEVRVVPDEVVLSVGVETADKNLAVAKQVNDERINRALAVTKKFAIPAQHVQTDYISVEPRYRQGEIFNELLGYVVRKSIVIRFKDIAQFEALLTALLESGVNHVHGIEFRTTELRKHRDQARAMALKSAQEKAQAMATTAGRKADKVTSISESGNWWSGYGNWWGSRWNQGGAQNAYQNAGGSSSESEGALAPGQITVRSTVSVSFLLE
jgi:uncharacterized protein